jgi:hypothetical protein
MAMMQTVKFVTALSLLILMGLGVLVGTIYAAINAVLWLVGA